MSALSADAVVLKQARSARKRLEGGKYCASHCQSFFIIDCAYARSLGLYPELSLTYRGIPTCPDEADDFAAAGSG